MLTRYGAPVAGSEKEVLSGFLDHYRQVMVDVCEGLSEEQLRRPMVPSGTSLLGLVKHLAYTERGWFQEGVAGEPFEYPFDPEDFEEEFRLTDGESSSEVFDLYRAACERSRRALEDVSLDDLVNVPGRDVPYRVRWIVVHMIEETARHAGHADILREQLGGTTGTGYAR